MGYNRCNIRNSIYNCTNNRISAALGSLDTARCPSTKDMPKTINGLAYTASL